MKNKKDINKEIRVFHIRSTDWWRRQAGRSGPQLHSLFSELSTQSNPATAMNVDCDLWSRAMVETAYVTCVCAYVLRALLGGSRLRTSQLWSEQAAGHSQRSMVFMPSILNSPTALNVHRGRRQDGSKAK